MKIHQVTSEYHNIEDRLLLKLSAGNNVQFHFWLTRRFCSQLLTVLADIIGADATLLSDQQANTQQAVFDSEKTRKQVLQDPQTKQALLNFQRDAALSKADFSQTQLKPAAETPLGDQPILAAKLAIISRTQGLPIIEVSDMHGHGLKIVLDNTLLHSLYKLLHDASIFAKWQLIDVDNTAIHQPSSDRLN